MKAVTFKKYHNKLGNVLLVLCLLALNSAPLSGADALTTLENDTAVPAINDKKLMNFSPYIDGQDPNTGIVLTENQIRQRMQIIAPYSRWIRSFSCGNGLEVIGRLAHEMKLKVAVNAWIGNSDTVNQQQIDCLISQANAGHVDLAIVGSEALLRGDVTPDTLIGYIDQVRQAIPLSIPVTTADVYTTFLGNPLLVDHIDLIFANIYPFWEGYKIQHGVSMLNYYYNQLMTTYPTKAVKISETGWPSCGAFGEAIGSLTNEASYFSQAETWARDKNVTLFYFEGLDERWKLNYEGPQGGCWGIWYKNGSMKPGMAPVFAGTPVSYDLQLPTTCDTNQFSFNFTYVPPPGSFDNVQGKTCGVFHKDYKIMLYIKVAGNWWVKPYAHQPTTSINPYGTWSVDYTTGGIDEVATEIRAYLIPTNEVGSCNAISDQCDFLMISVTRPADTISFDKSSPVNGVTNQPTSPMLSWGSVLNATSYEYCYDTTDNNTCNSNWISAGSNTSVALSGLTPSTTYFWQVRATNPANNGTWWSFTTHPDTEITISGNAGIGYATLRYMDGTSRTAIADENGAYSFTVPYNWAGIATPSMPGYIFTPASQSYLNMTSDQIAQDYTATVIPLVTSITRAGPNPASTTSVEFMVTFSEAVTGVDSDDFELTTSGVTGVSLVGVSGSGDTYTVSVNTASGNGTIRLDVIDNDTIQDGTNSPLGGTGIGNGNFTVGEIYDVVNSPMTVFSIGLQDGWILESTETSSLGGASNKNSSTLRVGDDTANRQFRTILSFDTSSLPDDAAITSVTLRFRYAGKTGTLPFGTTHGNLLVDMCEGGFKNNSALQLSDFNVRCPSGFYKVKALIYSKTLVDNWYSQTLLPADFQFINLEGVTQFRLRFARDDNNDFGADFLRLFSGNAAEWDRPQLVIEYQVP